MLGDDKLNFSNISMIHSEERPDDKNDFEISKKELEPFKGKYGISNGQNTMEQIDKKYDFNKKKKQF